MVRFNLSAYVSSAVQVKSHENQVGPQVIHIYELGNRGPSDITKADVYILWPTKTLTGKDLLYLVDRPIVDGPASCQLMEQFNPLALKVRIIIFLNYKLMTLFNIYSIISWKAKD